MGFPIAGTKFSFLISPIISFSIFFHFSETQMTKKEAFLQTIAFSLGFYFLGFYWIPGTITEFGQIQAPLNHLLGTLSIFVICPHLFAYSFLNKYFKNKTKHKSLNNIIKTTLFLFLQYTIPQLFSAYPGHAWIKLAPYLYPASIFGEPLFSFISILAAFEIATIYKSKLINRLNWYFIALTFLLCFIPSSPSNHGPNFDLNVRITQANIGNNAKLSAEKGVPNSVDKVLSTYKRLSTKEPYSKLDLIIWPETAYPYSIDPYVLKGQIHLMPEVFREINSLTGADIFFGSYLRDIKSVRRQSFNSAFFVGNNKDNNVYNKNRLIPFGESLPFNEYLNTIIIHYVPGISLFSKSDKTNLFESITKNGQTYQFIGLICYEALAPELLRKHINSLTKVPQFMANLTNDSWFGMTSEPEQHLFLARWRSAEFKIPMIRSANTGISTFIDKNGVEFRRGGKNTAEYIDAVVNVDKSPQKSIYLRLGFLPLIILVFVFFVLQFYFLTNPSRRRS